MADPAEGIRSTTLHRVTEGIVSATQAESELDTGGSEYIYLQNKGASSVYVRADTAETTATPGVAGNGQLIESGKDALIFLGKVGSVSIICATGETATVFYRLYS